jgi:hypothetical protein
MLTGEASEAGRVLAVGNLPQPLLQPHQEGEICQLSKVGNFKP